MVRLLALVPVALVAATSEEDAMMLQSQAHSHDHESSTKSLKKMARGLTELWCYRFCGSPITRPHNPYAQDVDCSVPKRHPSAHVADMCDRYCVQSDVWTTLDGRKCVKLSGLLVGKLPAASTLDEAKAWCEGMTVDMPVTYSDGTTDTKPKKSCGSIQHIPGSTKYSWEAVDISVNENQFQNKCGNHGSWTAHVFTGHNACGRNSKPGLEDSLCGNSADNRQALTDFEKQMRGYCSAACVPSSTGECEINPNRLDFVGVTGGTNQVAGNDNCADYCVDANDGTGKCKIAVTEADLCPNRT